MQKYICTTLNNTNEKKDNTFYDKERQTQVSIAA